MKHMRSLLTASLAMLVGLSACDDTQQPPPAPALVGDYRMPPPTPDVDPNSIRVMTFNIEDVSTEQIKGGDDLRLQRIAQVIQSIQPEIVLINEIATDRVADAWSAGWIESGDLADRFCLYLAESQGPGLEGLSFESFMGASNTGIHSGVDLDNNNVVASEMGSREYGGDSLGYGTYPGQYGMAVLIRGDGVMIDRQGIRTFRTLLWKDMPDAMLPTNPDGSSWYSDEALAVLPLSSKSHWDVPVKLPDGRVLHLLCSHPTPPVFDGPEDRNGRRNHDEIRFWRDYIDGADWIVDDAGLAGGLPEGASFVIMGDLNADPNAGDSVDNPMGSLIAHERVQDPIPASTVPVAGLSDVATSSFKLRVDYVLPSSDLTVVGSGVWRGPADTTWMDEAPAIGLKAGFPSDHYPVWADIALNLDRTNP